jgi:hypothetical protein
VTFVGKTPIGSVPAADAKPEEAMQAHQSRRRNSWKDDPGAKMIAASLSSLLIVGLIVAFAALVLIR